jgi:hypothetical protein
MADIQITKIIVLRGESADLPANLDAGELAFSTDEGRLFIGCDPTSGQPQFGRTDFPFRNIEILTENTTELFAKMHGDRMKEGGGLDYYDARLEPDTNSWAAVRVTRDGELNDYRITDIASVSAFIDYAVSNMDGIPMRMGNMHLTHYTDYAGEPHLADNGSTRRNLGLVDGANYEPTQVYGLVLFRFKVAGPINSQYLIFQYKNLTSGALNFRFKVSRPAATYYETGTIPVETPPETPNL